MLEIYLMSVCMQWQLWLATFQIVVKKKWVILTTALNYLKWIPSQLQKKKKRSLAHVSGVLDITMAAEAPCETVTALRVHISVDTVQHLSSTVITFLLPLTIDYCHFNVSSPAVKNSPTWLETEIKKNKISKENNNQTKTWNKKVGVCRDRRRKAWTDYIVQLCQLPLCYE